MSEVRLKRAESLLLHEISELISRQVIKDPRVNPLAAITKVSLSKDLKYSKIYISFYGELKQRKECVQGLNHAAGFIQKELGTRLRLRFIPKLSFLEDNSIEQGFRVTQKLRDIFS